MTQELIIIWYTKSRIAECFVFIFYFNATAAHMKKFRVSAYSRDRLIGE